MTPKELDWIANGVPVKIMYRGASPDRPAYYATIHDFSRYGVQPVETVRVPATREITEADCLAHPAVLAVLAEYNSRVIV